MDTISDDEFNATIHLDLEQRYACFVERIVKTGTVWALKDSGGFVMMGDDFGESFVPVWPDARYAAAYASDGEIPEPIPLDAWVERWLPGLRRDGSGIAVFPALDSSGAVVDIEDHLEDLEQELAGR